MALATLAYGSYKYLTSTAAVKEPEHEQGTGTGAGVLETDEAACLSSNRLRPKQRTDVSISLVVSKSVLRQMEQYNTEHEDGVDLQNYLRLYPHMVVVLYPGLTPADVECYFELDDSVRHRVLETGKEESVFHVLKQVGSDITLLSFDDFKLDRETIDRRFRLDNVLPNVVSLDRAFFIDYI